MPLRPHLPGECNFPNELSPMRGQSPATRQRTSLARRTKSAPDCPLTVGVRHTGKYMGRQSFKRIHAVHAFKLLKKNKYQRSSNFKRTRNPPRKVSRLFLNFPVV